MEAACDAPAALDWPAPQVARITLTRGDRHNTLTYEMLTELEALYQRAGAGGARVLILTGSGKTFCGGAHVKYFTDTASPLYKNPRAIRDDYLVRILEVFRKFQQAPCVTIAAINGFALGGGCELALQCDFRLMSDSARIGLTETRLGIVAAGGGVQLLGRILGRARALEVTLSGDQWTAAEALHIGLVTAVLPQEELERAALDYAKRFLRCSPISIAETKRALYRCETATLEEADRIALDAVTAATAGPDLWEGMAAFTEKRAASFVVEG